MREYLKNRRNDLRLTQEDVAGKAGISQNYYCNIEQGKKAKHIGIELLDKIAAALNTELFAMVELELDYLHKRDLKKEGRKTE